MEETKEIIEIVCNAISDRKCLEVYYESKSGKKPRTVEPYIVGIKDGGKGNIFFAALPLEELSKNMDDRKLGHYLLKDIDIRRIKVLSETFIEPGVPRKKIVDTPTIKVICRFIYPDEDGQEVMKKWVKKY